VALLAAETVRVDLGAATVSVEDEKLCAMLLCIPATMSEIGELNPPAVLVIDIVTGTEAPPAFTVMN
jgi:hypothetical protein